MTPRDYLLDRFRADGETLRQRAAALRRGPAQPGPDASMSQSMAGACDDVYAMIEALPAHAPLSDMLDALSALGPLLEQRATSATMPPVRSVYVGAATRIREVLTVERQHAVLRVSDTSEHQDDTDASLGDDSRDDDPDDAALDDDMDDDDIDDDELHVDSADDIDDRRPRGGDVG